MSRDFRIETADAKYGVIVTPFGDAYATRHGYMWRSLADAPHVVTLARDLQVARDALSVAGEDPLAQGTPPASYGARKDLLVIEMSDGGSLVQDAEGKVRINTPRGAEIALPGDNLALAFAYEIEGARARLDEIRSERTMETLSP